MNLAKHNETISHKGTGDAGVLLIHGITSTTSSMQYLAEKFMEAGYHVELPSLPGHGTVWQDLNRVTYQDWLAELDKALTKLQNRCDKVFICGLSLGGALALRLAQLHPETDGMILINHACKFQHPKFWFVPIMRYFIPSTPAVASDIKDPSQTEIAYKQTPTKAVYQMLLMLKQIRIDLPKTMIPVLMLKSLEDHVIPVYSTQYTYDNIGSADKKIVWLKNSYHVATQDYDKEIIVEESLKFMEKQNKKPNQE